MQTIVKTDHPLSLGREVRLITCNPLFDKHTTNLGDLHEESFTTFHGIQPDHHDGYCTLHTFEELTEEGVPERHYVIWINKDVKLLRLMEIIAHEISHLVDQILDSVQLDKIDTELRAYYTDWLVGKLLRFVPVIAEHDIDDIRI